MSAGWATLLVAALLFAVLMLGWNLLLMRLLDIARGDVVRLSRLLHPSRQTLSLLEPQDGAS